MPGKRREQPPDEGSPEKEAKKSRSKPKAPLPIPRFGISQFLVKEKERSADVLDYNIGPGIPHEQIRALDRNHVADLVQDQLSKPLQYLQVTVWHHRRMPLATPSPCAPATMFLSPPPPTFMHVYTALIHLKVLSSLNVLSTPCIKSAFCIHGLTRMSSGCNRQDNEPCRFVQQSPIGV